MNEFQKYEERERMYYQGDYSVEDLKVIAAYFDREIAGAIYHSRLTESQRERMKQIFFKKTKEAPTMSTPKEVVKALCKELEIGESRADTERRKEKNEI